MAWLRIAAVAMGKVLSNAPEYLEPYLKAVRRHGSAFGSLLWASPVTQAARFSAICRMQNLDGQSILDVGCGRAVLFDYLLSRDIHPASYTGIEAVDELAEAAESKGHCNVKIIRAD